MCTVGSFKIGYPYAWYSILFVKATRTTITLHTNGLEWGCVERFVGLYHLLAYFRVPVGKPVHDRV